LQNNAHYQAYIPIPFNVVLAYTHPTVLLSLQMYTSMLLDNQKVTTVPLKHSTKIIEGDDGNVIELFIAEPDSREGPVTCVLHVHGGFMCMTSAENVLYRLWRDR